MHFEKRPAKKSKKGYTWTVKFYYVDEFGVKKRFCKNGFETKQDAEDYGIKAKKEIEQGTYINTSKAKTFNHVFREYMEVERKYKYADSTEYYYLDTFKNHIEKGIGQCKITDLCYLKLQKYFNSIETNGKATNKNIKKIFCVTMKYALKNKYISENPMPMVEIRGVDKEKSNQILSLNQIDRLVESLLETRQGRKANFTSYSICVFLYLGYYLGTRKSETLAITKSDVDFEKNEIHINKRVEYHAKKTTEMYLTDRMKTKGSSAIIPMCAPLKNILQKWFEYNQHELVCCTESGTLLNPYNVDYALKTHAERLGFVFRAHMLRHTYVTNLIYSGTDVKTVSRLARHSDIRTTLQVYTQVEDDRLVDAINNTFNESPQKAPNLI